MASSTITFNYVLTFLFKICVLIVLNNEVNSLTLQNRTVLRKCCPTDLFLDPWYKCVNLHQLDRNYTVTTYDYTVPLLASGSLIDLVHGFPNNTIDNDYCVDKMVKIQNKTFVAKTVGFGNTEIAKSNGLLKIIPLQKCCPNGYVYDLKLHYCTNEFSEQDRRTIDIPNRLYDKEPKFINYDIGLFNCIEAVVDVTNVTHWLSLVDDILTITDYRKGARESYTRGSYCVDQSLNGTIMAKICRSTKEACHSTVCLRKCCPDGQIYKKKACTNSAFHPMPFKPKFYRIINGHSVPVENVEFATIPAYKCPLGKYLMNDTEAVLTSEENGKLYLFNAERTADDYCAENVYFPPAFNGLRVFRCFPAVRSNIQNDQRTFFEEKLVIYAYGMIISCVFLSLTLFVYFCLPELQNVHGKTLMCHVTCLLLGYIILIIQDLKVIPLEIKKIHNLCKIFGYAIIFLFMASFAWLNIMCFDIWLTFRDKRTSTVRGSAWKKRLEIKRFVYYNIYAWIGPTIITVLCIVFDHYDILPFNYTPGVGFENCFFSFSRNGYIIFFSIPVAILWTCDVFLFILTLFHYNRVKADIHRMQADSRGNSRKKRFLNDRARYIMNIKLFLVMGISWIHEVFGMYKEYPMFWYIGDIFNCLLGIPIFIIFVAKPKIWHLLRARICGKKRTISSAGSRGSATTTSCSDLTRTKIHQTYSKPTNSINNK